MSKVKTRRVSEYVDYYKDLETRRITEGGYSSEDFIKN